MFGKETVLANDTELGGPFLSMAVFARHACRGTLGQDFCQEIEHARRGSKDQRHFVQLIDVDKKRLKTGETPGEDSIQICTAMASFSWYIAHILHSKFKTGSSTRPTASSITLMVPLRPRFRVGCTSGSQSPDREEEFSMNSHHKSPTTQRKKNKKPNNQWCLVE